MKIQLIIVTLLALTVYPASAHFDDSWDWHNVTVNGTSQYKTTIHYCLDASVNATWKAWIEEAVQNWNNAATGWTIAEGPPCQVTIRLMDIPASEYSGGAYVEGFGSTDSNGRVSNLTMVFDTNLSDELWGGKAPDGWGRNGSNTLDPVVVAKHEFSHVLRMEHSGAGVDTGNLEDPVTPGNHNHTVSQSDRTEARKGTVNRTARIGTGTVTPAGGNREFDGFKVIFREGSLFETADIGIRPLSRISTPAPANVPPGTDAIIIGVDIRSDPAAEMLEVPASVTISYTEQDLSGNYFIGDRQRAPLGPVDESTLKAFSYDPAIKQWKELPGSVVDKDANTVTFDTVTLGFLGIGASLVKGPHVVAGKVVEISHSETGGLSTLVVEDKNGDRQTVTIPISEGKAINVGDEVEITVMTAGVEGMVKVGDILEGTVTNIQNVVSEGTSGVTIITVTGPDGNEHKITVPLAEGTLLSVGDSIKIPITGLEGEALKGAGTMTHDGENVTGPGGDEPAVIEGTVTGVRHSGGSSIITVQDPKGAEHEITVPLSEGENIKLGVKVSVKIVKRADGTIESIDVTRDESTPGFGAVMTFGLLSLACLLMRRKRQ